ncbi:hypothetical protein C9374_009314 [Naegleria lovaniensis]|uniref:Mediator complex subunit 16 n=1 Tax=Naegleria lovaniensis TaxID=51637 RepID=A0AA88GF85_NAELO|nr:uncharacterized protein C9374_009314 [Naegleria lovaniensis]KAG2377403.1 hypothetical protein C9374_009314 [Naegleria lovaniensis]
MPSSPLMDSTNDDDKMNSASLDDGMVVAESSSNAVPSSISEQQQVGDNSVDDGFNTITATPSNTMMDLSGDSSTQELNGYRPVGVISFNKLNMLVYTFQNKMFIMDPNEPMQMETIPSNHMYDNISGCSWQANEGIPLLLTNDSYNTISLWKSGDHCVNDFVLRKTFYSENVLCCKWCDSIRIFTIHPPSERLFETEGEGELLENRYQFKTSVATGLAHGSRAFIVITSHGRVLLYFFDHAKARWVTSTIQLNLDCVTSADFTILNNGQICVACNERDSSAVHISYFGIEVGRNVDATLPFNLKFISRSVFVLDHLVDGLYFIPFMDRLIVKTKNNKFKSFFQKDHTFSISKVIPISEELRNSLSGTVWKEHQNFDMPEGDAISFKTSVDGQYLIFISRSGRITFYIYNLSSNEYVLHDEISNIFLDGASRELVKESNLVPSRKKRKTKQANTISSSVIVTNKPEILDACLSPNSTILAVLDSHMRVKLFTMKKNSIEIYRKMMDCSMLNGFDKWDLLASIRNQFTNTEIIELADSFGKSMNNLTQSNIHFWQFQHDTFALFINSMLPSAEKRALVLVAQSITYCNSILQILRAEKSIASLGVLHAQNRPESFEELMKYCEEISAKLNVDDALSFICTANWTIRLLLFIKKCMTDLINEGKTKTVPDFSLSVYYLIGSLKSQNLLPLLLKELVIVSVVVLSLTPKMKQENQIMLLSKHTITHAVNFFWKLLGSIEATLKKTETYKGDHINPIIIEECSKILSDVNKSSYEEALSNYSTQQHLEILDLSPMMKGFLYHPNFIDILPHRKQVDSITKVTPVVERPERILDPKRPLVTLKVCKLCNRVTQQDPSPIFSWSKRFSMSCLMCGSFWKRCSVESWQSMDNF